MPGFALFGSPHPSAIWHEHGLKPHLARTFKVSNDPNFAEKLEDIVGLYLNAPEHALVLGCDEKSQVQALDRSVGEVFSKPSFEDVHQSPNP